MRIIQYRVKEKDCKRNSPVARYKKHLQLCYHPYFDEDTELSEQILEEKEVLSSSQKWHKHQKLDMEVKLTSLNEFYFG